MGGVVVVVGTSTYSGRRCAIVLSTSRQCPGSADAVHYACISSNTIWFGLG